MLAAGRLNKRVTLQAPETGVDAIGQPLSGWTDVATVWADVRYLSGTEALKANAVTALTAASVRIRYRSGVHAGMRLILGSRVLNIKAILPGLRNEYIDLVCEVVA